MMSWNFQSSYFWLPPNAWFSCRRKDSNKDSFIVISGFWTVFEPTAGTPFSYGEFGILSFLFRDLNKFLKHSHENNSTTALDSQKNLDLHNTAADLTSQTPAKFCQPNDFFSSPNAFLRGLRDQQNKNVEKKLSYFQSCRTDI